jgi:hypothetical protein
MPEEFPCKTTKACNNKAEYVRYPDRKVVKRFNYDGWFPCGQQFYRGAQVYAELACEEHFMLQGWDYELRGGI